MHRTAQRRLPVVLVGAGLPQLRGRMGQAKSYAERLFDFPEIGALAEPAAKIAIRKPAEAQGVEIKEDALRRIVKETHRYPYFLQEWGKHAWDAAIASPISLRDVGLASKAAVAALDESFFRVRFDRLTRAASRLQHKRPRRASAWSACGAAMRLPERLSLIAIYRYSVIGQRCEDLKLAA